MKRRVRVIFSLTCLVLAFLFGTYGYLEYREQQVITQALDLANTGQFEQANKTLETYEQSYEGMARRYMNVHSPFFVFLFGMNNSAQNLPRARSDFIETRTKCEVNPTDLCTKLFAEADVRMADLLARERPKNWGVSAVKLLIEAIEINPNDVNAKRMLEWLLITKKGQGGGDGKDPQSGNGKKIRDRFNQPFENAEPGAGGAGGEVEAW